MALIECVLAFDARLSTLHALRGISTPTARMSARLAFLISLLWMLLVQVKSQLVLISGAMYKLGLEVKAGKWKLQHLMLELYVMALSYFACFMDDAAVSAAS